MNKKYAQTIADGSARRRPRRSRCSIRRCSSAGFAAAHTQVSLVLGRAQALQALQKAIDEVGFMVTSDREYFYARSSSID